MNKASKTLAIISMILLFASIVGSVIFNIVSGILIVNMLKGGLSSSVYTTIVTVERVIRILMESTAFVLAIPALITGCVGLKKSTELKAKTGCGFAVGSSVIVLIASGLSTVSMMINLVTPMIEQLF